MVKNIVSQKYPQRKNSFKKMVNEFRSQWRYNKKPQQILLTKYSSESNESVRWFSKNPERWKKFQKEYQVEFKEKLELLDKIRDRKKENEVFYLIQAEDFI